MPTYICVHCEYESDNRDAFIECNKCGEYTCFKCSKWLETCPCEEERNESHD